MAPPQQRTFDSRRPGFLLLGLSLLSGCAGYQIGANTLYRSDVRTVHVPIFRSNSLRRGVGERLTEAVIKRIESQTPYRTATAETADSLLEGRIVLDQKSVLVEDRFDAPRDLESQWIVEIMWTDRNGTPLMQRQTLLADDPQLNIAASTSYIPESGQSLAWAQQQSIERLADRIVSQMEVW